MEIIGIGLSNIDLMAHVDDAFLARHKVPKGSVRKCDTLSFARLRADLSTFDAIPGGCAANTICGMAAHGVSTRFFGKIGNDSFESLYRASFHEYGVAYDVKAGTQETSQCAVLVTPDGERSFAYIHGASWDLEDTDLDLEVLAQARLIYAEIYLFEFGRESRAAKAVFDSVLKHKTPLVMKVLDSDFGKKCAQKLKALSDAGVLTLLVGNHFNLPCLTGTNDIPNTIKSLSTWNCNVLLTANTHGAYFLSKGDVFYAPATPIPNPKNTAGAGDQFLAGFLMGQLDNKPIHECMEFAASCAKSILMHDTTRPPLVNRHSIRF